VSAEEGTGWEADDLRDADGSAGVGSVSEEAAKLFGVLSDWAREHEDTGRETGQDTGQDTGQRFSHGFSQGFGEGLAGLAGEAADAVRGLDAHLAAGDPGCRWCPVCRTIHLVRECTPEVRDQLAVAAAHLMQAAAGLLVAASGQQRRGHPSGERVQHIDLDDGPDGPDAPGGAP